MRRFNPHTYRLHVRDLVQLRRITFRAVRGQSRTALFVCSESDTSLKNYITITLPKVYHVPDKSK